MEDLELLERVINNEIVKRLGAIESRMHKIEAIMYQMAEKLKRPEPITQVVFREPKHRLCHEWSFFDKRVVLDLDSGTKNKIYIDDLCKSFDSYLKANAIRHTAETSCLGRELRAWLKWKFSKDGTPEHTRAAFLESLTTRETNATLCGEGRDAHWTRRLFFRGLILNNEI